LDLTVGKSLIGKQFCTIQKVTVFWSWEDTVLAACYWDEHLASTVDLTTCILELWKKRKRGSFYV